MWNILNLYLALKVIHVAPGARQELATFPAMLRTGRFQIKGALITQCITIKAFIPSKNT